MVGMSKKKKIISIFVVFALVMGLMITAKINMTTISDDDVPLAGGGYSATYYVYNPSFKNIWTYFCDYVGEGTISERVSVDNDAAYVNSLIVSSPDYSASYPGYYIEWRAIYLMRNKTYVVGFFCDPPADEEKSIAEEMAPTEEITEVDPEHVDELVDEVVDMIEEQNPEDVLDESDSTNSIVEEIPIEEVLSKNEMLTAQKQSFPSGSTIKYDSWRMWDGWKSGHLISNEIKTDYLDDPVYTSMKLPNEVTTYRHLINPVLCDYKPEGCIDALGMGGIYPIEGATLPDTFNIYFGKLATYILYEGSTQWEVLDSHDVLDSMYYFSFYKTPTGGFIRKATDNEYEITDSYVKFTFHASDFNNAMFHFWGLQKPAIAENVAGIVTMYEVWTDTPEAVGTLAAAIGIDQRDSSGGVHQACLSGVYAVTTDKRTIICHNIPDDVYYNCINNGYSPAVCYDMFKNQ